MDTSYFCCTNQGRFNMFDCQKEYLARHAYSVRSMYRWIDATVRHGGSGTVVPTCIEQFWNGRGLAALWGIVKLWSLNAQFGKPKSPDLP